MVIGGLQFHLRYKYYQKRQNTMESCDYLYLIGWSLAFLNLLLFPFRQSHRFALISPFTTSLCSPTAPFSTRRQKKTLDNSRYVTHSILEYWVIQNRHIESPQSCVSYNSGDSQEHFTHGVVTAAPLKSIPCWIILKILLKKCKFNSLK